MKEKKSQESQFEPVVTGLARCMSEKTPIAFPGKPQSFEVRGPFSIGNDDFPFHLFARHEKPDGTWAEARVGVDPYRKSNGKPLKGNRKNRAVRAVECSLFVAGDGTKTKLNVVPVDYVTSLVRMPERE